MPLLQGVPLGSLPLMAAPGVYYVPYYMPAVAPPAVHPGLPGAGSPVQGAGLGAANRYESCGDGGIGGQGSYYLPAGGAMPHFGGGYPRGGRLPLFSKTWCKGVPSHPGIAACMLKMYTSACMLKMYTSACMRACMFNMQAWPMHMYAHVHVHAHRKVHVCAWTLHISDHRNSIPLV